ncbi:MAG: IS4 family transposase, partial [Chloroflexota bacterium]|nr:IS4 family transposase [Chloroflexota bacterium]
MTTLPETRARPKSTVRHTRAIQRDRRHRPTVAPPDPALAPRLTELIHPATLAQVHAYHALGLRERTLTLPIMMAFVLSLIWRQVGTVQETVRLLQREGLLWTAPLRVSQQAISQRLQDLPADLFAAVYHTILPAILARWQAWTRPLAPALAWAHARFAGVWALDGSTLDGLLRHAGLLRDSGGTPLAGRMVGLLDGAARVPRQLWYDPDSTAHDQTFWERVLPALPAEILLLIDLGWVNYAHYDQLTERRVWLLTRAKTNAATTVRRVLARTATLRDEIVTLGSPTTACTHPMRLIQICYQGHWYRYVTNVLDPAVLPAEYVVALYGQRWRIEEAFAVVKRLLGLAYFWTGGQNGIAVQVWATWILYGVLVDLRDAVAEELAQPADALSLEMVYRALYHCTQAYQRGATTDPIAYLAAEA